MSSAYHPQSDGQSEVVNCCLENYLRCFTGAQPKNWIQWLSWAEWSYNTTYHTATKISPYEAAYRQAPPPVVGFEVGWVLLTWRLLNPPY